MRTRVAVLVLVALMVTACPSADDGTTTIDSAGTSSTAGSTTTPVEPTSTTSSELVSLDPDWACYYVPGVVAVPVPDGTDRASYVEGVLGFLDGSGIPAEEIFPDDEMLLGGGDIPGDLEAISNQIEPVLALISTTENDPVEVSEFLKQEMAVEAAPIHAVAPATHWVFKPGTDPVPIDVELDPVDDADENNPYVAVVDTGFVQEAASWAETPNVLYDEYDIEQEPGAASHGTFITGLIRQISPANRVSIARVPFRDGGQFDATNETAPSGVLLSDELHVFEAVIRLMNRHQANGTDVVALNMSLGTYTCDPEGDDLLVTLVAALNMWDDAFSGSTTFAAGGNEEHNQPFWPGALDTARAVAAANLDGQQVVWHENEEIVYPGRPWIDDVAPGSNLVSLSGAGNTQYVGWSGSSFATAVASALLARGENPFVDASRLNWWLDFPVDYDNVSGLTYTQSPDPTEPVIHVVSPETTVTVPTVP